MKSKWFAVTAHARSIEWSLLFIRVVMGAAFVLHGWGKIQSPMSWMGPEAPVPGVLQFLAAFSEFGGGIALILGFLTRLAGVGLAITMLVAAAMHAFVLKDPFVASGPGQGSYELAAIYFALSIFFILAGPGRLSLDAKVFGTRG